MRSSPIAVLLLAFTFSACRPEDSRRADFHRWSDGQKAYQTNDIPVAYAVLLKLKGDLEQMQAAGHRNLDYTYCGAILNGQLFAMAEQMGQTNAADGFYQESARRWAEQRRSLRLPPEEPSRAEVRRLIEAYDAKTGPALWRQPDHDSSKN
jgi:hypothetical protein